MSPPPLTGKTVLRFAHAFESGGGTERYLDDLDRALLERNTMTIVRLHLTRSPSPTQAQESIGKGRLIRIGLPVSPGTPPDGEARAEPLSQRLKQAARNHALYNPIIWRAGGARWALSRRSPSQPGQALGAGAAAAAVMRTRRVDLVMLHFFGGLDADEIVAQARANGVPFAVLNHYSNDRFLHLAIRKHAMMADGVAGVNSLQVPRYLRGRFHNLSDGIDTKFFSRANARPPADPSPEPIVLLPARVVREKGQLDLVRAAASLRDAGVRCSIVFAGRFDASKFLGELREEIARAGLAESARFLGAISVEALRDWYAASSVVAFPTYHHEGLGRVIVEAQAMGTPVVAYATGGVPDAIVDGATGSLVRTGDVGGLAKRLRELLLSSALRSSLATRGREAAERHFSLGALAERHEKFYLLIAADAARAARHPRS